MNRIVRSTERRLETAAPKLDAKRTRDALLKLLSDGDEMVLCGAFDLIVNKLESYAGSPGAGVEDVVEGIAYELRSSSRWLKGPSFT